MTAEERERGRETEQDRARNMHVSLSSTHIHAQAGTGESSLVQSLMLTKFTIDESLPRLMCGRAVPPCISEMEIS